MKQEVVVVDEILPTLDVSSPLKKIGFPWLLLNMFEE